MLNLSWILNLLFYLFKTDEISIKFRGIKISLDKENNVYISGLNKLVFDYKEFYMGDYNELPLNEIVKETKERIAEYQRNSQNQKEQVIRILQNILDDYNRRKDSNKKSQIVDDFLSTFDTKNE